MMSWIEMMLVNKSRSICRGSENNLTLMPESSSVMYVSREGLEKTLVCPRVMQVDKTVFLGATG